MHRNINNIALIGNPNCGKSTLFNHLTGLSQHTGNFPGITVDKKTGVVIDNTGRDIILTDLPGTYSLYPTAKDDMIVVETLMNTNSTNRPDAIMYVADVTFLKKQLLLLSQVADLGIPCKLVLTMAEYRSKEEIDALIKQLNNIFGIEVIAVSIRERLNLEQLSDAITNLEGWHTPKSFYSFSKDENKLIEAIGSALDIKKNYSNLLIARHYKSLSFLSESDRINIEAINDQCQYSPIKYEVQEIMGRYDHLDRIIKDAAPLLPIGQQISTSKIDRIVTHPIIGPLIFISIMVLMFQAVYSWSGLPMDWIEQLFGWTSSTIANLAPDFWLTDLIANGLIAGLGGIVIFAPQIAILFLLIAILEESGYMSRVVYLFDPLMRRFGLNGRSLIAMISSGACAVPAIMSTRTIKNEKERLNTILTSPLISCSARLPVYTVLIGLMVPNAKIGFFNAQGLAFMGVYMLSIVSTLIAAYIIKLCIGVNKTGSLLIELPLYRIPVWRDIWISVWSKIKIFLLEAGKIILMISLLLWFLASFGPGDHKSKALSEIDAMGIKDGSMYADMLSAKELEYSYIGHIGKTIEPLIKPLGYDWKIGIALITSFAAREVFVGTMATIYSVGSNDNETSIRERMRQEINPVTGKPVYTLATSLSLLIFYLYAMQCMSTVAVVRRETGGWKWPIIQFSYMTALAIIGAFLVFQMFK